MALNPYLKSDTLECAIDMFRSCLSFQSFREPDVSVFLYVPNHIRAARAVKRSLESQGLNSDISVDQSPNKDNEVRSLWQRIEERVPYFHVVDGSLPQNTVTDTICEVVDKAAHL